MSKSIKSNAPSRSVTDVGPGDYIKAGGQFHRIVSNSAHGANYTPRSWTIITEDGSRGYGMYDIQLYAKAEDVE